MLASFLFNPAGLHEQAYVVSTMGAWIEIEQEGAAG
jgi:hypothetical protein